MYFALYAHPLSDEIPVRIFCNFFFGGGGGETKHIRTKVNLSSFLLLPLSSILILHTLPLTAHFLRHTRLSTAVGNHHPLVRISIS